MLEFQLQPNRDGNGYDVFPPEGTVLCELFDKWIMDMSTSKDKSNFHIYESPARKYKGVLSREKLRKLSEEIAALADAY